MLSQTYLKLKSFKFGKWQLLFLALLIVIAVFLLYDLAYMNILWDETPHLYGGLLVSQLRLSDYLALTRYPPLFDAIIAGFFKILGASVFTGRLVSATFGLLSLVVLYKLANRAYGQRVAFLSCVIMASMSGFLWLSRVTLLEMPLEFFFLLTIYLFVEWLHSGKNLTLFLSGISLGLVFLTKYQGIIAGIVVLAALPFMLYHSEYKAKISRFWLFIVATAAIVIPVLAFTYFSGTLGQWLSLMQISDTATNLYSVRFPQPIFYILELIQSLYFVHPISLLVLVLGLHGLAFFVWRRKPMDKFLVIWFVVIYVAFTLIATKSWRYVMPLAPVIAIAGASFVSFLFDKMQSTWRSAHFNLDTKWMAKFLAGLLILFTVTAIVTSTIDAYDWIAQDSAYPFQFPQAIHYVAGKLAVNDSVMVICPENYINMDMTHFYLDAYESKNNPTCQYPSYPTDAYTLNFNITEMIGVCQLNNVKYLLLFENHESSFMNTTLTIQNVKDMIIQSGKFYVPITFGNTPTSLWVFQINATSTQT